MRNIPASANSRFTARKLDDPQSKDEQPDSIYDQIKDAILNGQLQPMEQISETQIAELLGSSRTPVREAFRLLAAEGLIVVIPKRGSFVSKLSVDEILEIYQIRTPLECMATRIAAEALEEHQLAALERLVSRAKNGEFKSVRESLEASRAFHGIIVDSVRNKRLKALVMELQDGVHRARMLWPNTPDSLEETWRELTELLAALKSRDPELSERLMREHLTRARGSTLAGMMPATD